MNTQAQQAEQANQVQGEQYAAQQQAAAVAAINSYLAKNPSPNSAAAPLQAPGASSPATMGGGSFGGANGGQTSAAPAPPSQNPIATPGATGPAPIAQRGPIAGAAQPQSQPNLSPQQIQALVAQFKAQGSGGAMPQ